MRHSIESFCAVALGPLHWKDVEGQRQRLVGSNSEPPGSAFQWALQDSNLRLLVCKTSALATELNAPVASDDTLLGYA